MDSTIELGRGDVYVKSWSKQQRYSLSSSSGGSWLTRVSISDVDFCLRSSRDLLWQLLALSWQSTWTFILHTRHLKPWRVWPTKKEGDPNDWLSDWYLLPLWCSQAGDKNWLGSRCVTPRKCLQLICFPLFRVLTLIAFYVSLHWLREKKCT
jgi:hypothetical protein